MKQMKELVSHILGISNASYYRWKRERLGINLIEKYFTREDLEEYIATGVVRRMENRVESMDEMEEFYLKSALSKIEFYGAKKEMFRFTHGLKNKEKYIQVLLPVKTLMETLSNWGVRDKESFYKQLYRGKGMEDKKDVVRDFADNKLAKVEFNALVKHKKHAVSYIESLPHLHT